MPVLLGRGMSYWTCTLNYPSHSPYSQLIRCRPWLSVGTASPQVFLHVSFICIYLLQPIDFKFYSLLGSVTDNSVDVSLDELIRNMSMLLSLSSPEIAESADMPTREQQLSVLHHPNLHPVSSPIMPSQHGLTASQDTSEDLPLDLRVNPTERR